MTTQHQTEPSANNALGDLLRPMLPTCLVRTEQTQTIVGNPGRRPDILITAAGRSPVVVEAEYEPGADPEKDALPRLGNRIIDDLRTVEAAIALRYPATIATAYNLADALTAAALSYCVRYEDGSRFPQSGWLTGSVTDLADLIRLVSVPQKEVERAADALESGIERAATVLDRMSQLRPRVSADIAGLLGMSDVPQTRRMAGAILANALIFHERIAGMHDDVRPLRLLSGPAAANLQDAFQDATLAAWNRILEINYYPIFAIAKDILMQLPSGEAAQVLDVLQPTAQQVNAAGVDNAHDLTGRIFQRLIADRKYLATFYTLPASAALLARLAVAKLKTPSPLPEGSSITPSPLVGEGWGEGDNSFNWSDPAAIGNLRIGDFACGTGALLSAVYEQIASRHERAGGDPAALHPVMLEEVLYGCDVMPSAVHITGATLAGAQPNIGYRNSRLYTMPYGRQEDDTVKIGSLELLQPSNVYTLFNTSDPALRTGSAGEETAAQVNVEIPDDSFDLVIMNPPFTRNTGHEASHIGVFNPAFAAFEVSDTDQQDMGKRLTELKDGTCYHGNAGIASAFAGLAHRKLKPGGVLALVLPLSAAAGLSWQAFRKMLAYNYTDLTVLSIAANGKDMSFSSDTGMAECLVIARKNVGASLVGAPSPRTRFTSLRHRPGGFAQASAIAKIIVDSNNLRGIEDGPYGGTQLSVGDDVTGEILTAQQADDGQSWGSVRLLDYALAQTAYALTQSQLWLPAEPTPLYLKTVPLVSVGKLGLYHLDISGPPPRAPFAKTKPSDTATYPCLWNHDAKRETRIICEPDSQLQARPNLAEKAANVWSTASRAHLNRDFRFNSQPLCVAFTELIRVGGRAWPNVRFGVPGFDHAFTIWGNCTLGLLVFWWHSNRQVAGRGATSIRSAESLPVLDFRTLTDAQLATAQTIFNDFRDKELQPAYLADADPNRSLLDRRVVCDLLGFDESVYQGVRRLAAKWCAEPSVHGGKTRPANARLII